MSNPSEFIIENGVLKKYKGRDGAAIIAYCGAQRPLMRS